MAPSLKLLLLGVGATIVGVALSAHAPDVLIHNRSPSAPVGFYVRTTDAPTLGAFVTLPVPERARAYAATRSFGDETDRFLKRIVAIGGQTVCADGDRIVVDGNVRARRVDVDSIGRQLPSWSGCALLGNEQVFLLGDGDDSFDGRYWGVSDVSEIDGVWRRVTK